MIRTGVGGRDLSPGDRTSQKIPFYASVNVRELLVVERDPWFIELYRLDGGKLSSVEPSTPGSMQSLRSQVLPVTFTLLAGQRPQIEVAHNATPQRWIV